MKTIHDIAWSSLTHAEGSAGDVPIHLTALRSNQESTRAEALGTLHDLLFSGGWIYDATAATFPFLLELGLDPDTEGRADILLFVAQLSRSHLWFSGETPERYWALEMVEQLDARASEIASCITGDDDLAKAAIACLFHASARDYVASLITDVRDQISGPVELLALLASHGSDVDALDRVFEVARGASVRFAVLLAKSTIGGLSTKQLTTLRAAIVDPETRAPIEDALESAQGGLGSLSEIFAMIAPHIRDLLFESMVTYTEQQSGSRAREALLMLLGMTFPTSVTPLEPSSLAEPQTVVLKMIANWEAAWELPGTAEDLLEITGISAGSADELSAFLDSQVPVVALVMTPAESSLILHRLEQIDRLEWIDVPWIVFKGDTSALDQQIAEDDAYFTKQVMSDAYQIATTIIANISEEIAPNLHKFRFYPELSKEELIEVCQTNGWTVHEMPSWASELSVISESEVVDEFYADLDPGICWVDLEDRLQKEIDLCVEQLDAAGWAEAKKWHDFVQKGSAYVAPMMTARYFGLHTVEVCYWPYDHAIAENTGEHTGSRYLSLTIASNKTIDARLYFGHDLSALLELLIRHQHDLSMTDDGFSRFAKVASEQFEIAVEHSGMLHRVSPDRQLN